MREGSIVSPNIYSSGCVISPTGSHPLLAQRVTLALMRFALSGGHADVHCYPHDTVKQWEGTEAAVTHTCDGVPDCLKAVRLQVTLLASSWRAPLGLSFDDTRFLSCGGTPRSSRSAAQEASCRRWTTLRTSSSQRKRLRTSRRRPTATAGPSQPTAMAKTALVREPMAFFHATFAYT